MKDVTFSLIFEYDSPSENWKWKKCQKTLGLALEILDLDHETEWDATDKFEILHVRESRSQDSKQTSKEIKPARKKEWQHFILFP